jgi:hypothetical protein
METFSPRLCLATTVSSVSAIPPFGSNITTFERIHFISSLHSATNVFGRNFLQQIAYPKSKSRYSLYRVYCPRAVYRRQQYKKNSVLGLVL